MHVFIINDTSWQYCRFSLKPSYPLSPRFISFYKLDFFSFPGLTFAQRTMKVIGARQRGIGSARYNILAIHKTLTAECSAGFTIHCKYAAVPFTADSMTAHSIFTECDVLIKAGVCVCARACVCVRWSVCVHVQRAWMTVSNSAAGLIFISSILTHTHRQTHAFATQTDACVFTHIRAHTNTDAVPSVQFLGLSPWS